MNLKEKAEKVALSSGFHDTSIRDSPVRSMTAFITGAEFGYRLAVEELREQVKKNKDLAKYSNADRYRVVADYLESLLEEK